MKVNAKKEDELTPEQQEKYKKAKEKVKSELSLAELQATKINEMVLGQTFTHARLAKLSGKPIAEVKKVIYQLSTCFLVQYLGDRMQQPEFKICLDMKTRIASVRNSILLAQDQFAAEMNYLVQIEQDFIARSALKVDPPKTE